MEIHKLEKIWNTDPCTYDFKINAKCTLANIEDSTSEINMENRFENLNNKAKVIMIKRTVNQGAESGKIKVNIVNGLLHELDKLSSERNIIIQNREMPTSNKFKKEIKIKKLNEKSCYLINRT